MSDDGTADPAPSEAGATDPSSAAAPTSATGRTGGAGSVRAPGRRRVRVVAAVAVLVGVVVVVVAGIVVARLASDGDDGPTGAEAADGLVEAYTRYLDATFVVDGESTRTLADGRTLSSGYRAVQRPPDRIQRALGSTTGELDGRTINCSTGPDGAYSCATGAQAQPWPDQRAAILGALDTYVRGDDPLYSVSVDDVGCYVLVRRRTEPDASFGRGAQLCFDDEVGALRRLEVQREGGVTDTVLAVRISDQVSDADFDLGEDATYDPQAPDASAPDTSSTTQEQP